MSKRAKNPVQSILARQGVLLLDGGLATELEARGCDLSDELWSAGYLLMDPEIIRHVHLDYLHAGADCLVTATYQATLSGFRRRGASPSEARQLLELAVELALEAREMFWSQRDHRRGRLRPLVAASIGPYGAFRADASEYTGDYDLDEDGLVNFHRERFDILARGGADLLACETIPSHSEARALVRLLRDRPNARAWISFSCRDGRRISDGSELAAVAAELETCPQVVAIGVNCTAPRWISDLIGEIRRVSAKPIVVYPNSGEKYDIVQKCWIDDATPIDFAEACTEWVAKGARLIGGCCRTGPQHIRQMRHRLLERSGHARPARGEPRFQAEPPRPGLDLDASGISI